MLLLPCAAVFAVWDVFLLIAFIPSVTLLLIPLIWTMDWQMEILCPCLHLRSKACEETFRVTRCMVVFVLLLFIRFLFTNVLI